MILYIIIAIIIVFAIIYAFRPRATKLTGGALMNSFYWCNSFNQFYDRAINITQKYTKTQVPKNFLSMWIFENFGNERKEWKETEALHRCLKEKANVSNMKAATEIVNLMEKYKKIINTKIELNIDKTDYELNNNIITYLPTNDKIKVPNWILTKYKNNSIGEIYNMFKRYITLIYRTDSGNQLALNPNEYKKLNKQFKIKIECFASPLNHYFNKYCSIFPDTDKAFGSIGNFFEHGLFNENLVCNPPFEEEVMSAAFDILENSVAKNKITACFIVPCWEDAEAIIKAKKSKFLKKTILHKKEDKKYISYGLDGNITEVAPCDTYVFVFKQ